MMFNEVFQFLVFETGVPEGIRTPDLRIRSPLLYPAELQAQNGAGEGNRTLTASLEGWSSTTELHPHMVFHCAF